MVAEDVSICFISDTHNQHDFTPKPADVLIHTGDMTMYGYPDEIAEGLLWLQRQPHRYKAWLPGNHDMAMESDGFHRAMEMLVPGVTILRAGLNVVGPLGVAALPHMNLEGWAFHSTPEQIATAVNQLIAVRGKPEVLVTHAPPYTVLDLVPSRVDRFGRLRDACQAGIRQYEGLAKRIGTQVHAFGHIHEQGGREVVLDGVRHINCAVLERDYETVGHVGMLATVTVGAN